MKITEINTPAKFKIAESRRYLYEGLDSKSANSVMLWESVGNKLVEFKLSADQINQIFQQAEQGMTGQGANRTMIGKGKDAASLVTKAYGELKDKISNSGPVRDFDQKVSDVLSKIGAGAKDPQFQGQVNDWVQKYRDFATAHPVIQGGIYATLLAVAGISGAGVAGASAIGLLKMADKLLQGERASSAAYSGAKAGATAAAAGAIGNAIRGPGAADVGTVTGADMDAMTADPSQAGGGGQFELPDADAVANSQADIDAAQQWLNADEAGKAAIEKTTGMPAAQLQDIAVSNDLTPATDAATGATTQAGADGMAGQFAGGQYEIVKGDTLGHIAQANGVSAEDIKALNPQINWAKPIQPGMTLNLPPAGDGTGSVWQGYTGGVYGDQAPMSQAAADQLSGRADNIANAQNAAGGAGNQATSAADKIANGDYTQRVPPKINPDDFAKMMGNDVAGDQATSAADKIANGDYTQRVPPKINPDDFAKMANDNAVAPTGDTTNYAASKTNPLAQANAKVDADVARLNEPIEKANAAAQAEVDAYNAQVDATNAKNMADYQQRLGSIPANELGVAYDENGKLLPGWIKDPDQPGFLKFDASAVNSPASLKESVELIDRRQTARMWVLRESLGKQRGGVVLTEAGINAVLFEEGALKKIGNWFKQKGQNLTNKVTADKLKQAWIKAKMPNDSEQISQMLVKAGVGQSVINDIYQGLGIPTTDQTGAHPQGNMLQRGLGAVAGGIGAVAGTAKGMGRAYDAGKARGADTIAAAGGEKNQPQAAQGSQAQASQAQASQAQASQAQAQSTGGTQSTGAGATQGADATGQEKQGLGSKVAQAAGNAANGLGQGLGMIGDVARGAAGAIERGKYGLAGAADTSYLQKSQADKGATGLSANTHTMYDKSGKPYTYKKVNGEWVDAQGGKVSAPFAASIEAQIQDKQLAASNKDRAAGQNMNAQTSAFKQKQGAAAAQANMAANAAKAAAPTQTTPAAVQTTPAAKTTPDFSKMIMPQATSTGAGAFSQKPGGYASVKTNAPTMIPQVGKLPTASPTMSRGATQPTAAPATQPRVTAGGPTPAERANLEKRIQAAQQSKPTAPVAEGKNFSGILWRRMKAGK